MSPLPEWDIQDGPPVFLDDPLNDHLPHQCPQPEDPTMPKPQANEFDPITHTYRINGRPVPSVTQVLGDVLPGWKASEWYLQRGSAVHAAAAFIARGQEFDFDPAITMQVFALQHFFSQVAPVVLAVEQQVYSEPHQYAGTYDLLCEFGGRRVLIDFKSTLGPSVPYQLAAYGALCPDKRGTRWGAGVEIRDDGTYSMSEVYDLQRYHAGWLALLATYNIRRACGIKTEETA